MPETDVTITAYVIRNNSIRGIHPVNVNGGGRLPSNLIINKGLYEIEGKIYDLSENGLYRFWSAAGLCEQRIVLDEFIYDIEELMSSICWIVCHGNSDDNKEHDLKVKKSLGDKLFLTCGASSLWIKRLLEEKHVKARVVTSLTEDEWNTYDNGHTLLEVFDSHLQRWIVVDVDMHCYF